MNKIGKIFRNMRAALKVPRDALARRLATSTAVIDSFEAGAISALPHWKETERIVRSYCDLLRFDPEPVLWRLRSQLQAVANYARPAPLAAGASPAVDGASGIHARNHVRSRSGEREAAAPSPQGPHPLCAEYPDCVCRRTRLLGAVGLETCLSGHCLASGADRGAAACRL